MNPAAQKDQMHMETYGKRCSRNATTFTFPYKPCPTTTADLPILKVSPPIISAAVMYMIMTFKCNAE